MIATRTPQKDSKACLEAPNEHFSGGFGRFLSISGGEKPESRRLSSELLSAVLRFSLRFSAVSFVTVLRNSYRAEDMPVEWLLDAFSLKNADGNLPGSPKTP